jgi:hypothetical protein
MKKNDIVKLYQHSRYIKDLIILNVGVLNDLNNKSCYETNFGLFYMEPKLHTNHHYNVGNNAFYIKNPNTTWVLKYDNMLNKIPFHLHNQVVK